MSEWSMARLLDILGCDLDDVAWSDFVSMIEASPDLFCTLAQPGVVLLLRKKKDDAVVDGPCDAALAIGDAEEIDGQS